MSPLILGHPLRAAVHRERSLSGLAVVGWGRETGDSLLSLLVGIVDLTTDGELAQAGRYLERDRHPVR
jgi:hypothetical protein